MSQKCKLCGKTHRVGFVSTRLAGTDGVSLETAKWEQIFETEGFECFYFAGELDRPPDRSVLAEEAHFSMASSAQRRPVAQLSFSVDRGRLARAEAQYLRAQPHVDAATSLT